MRALLPRVSRLATGIGALLVIVIVAVVLGALAAGYRPVVIQTGSMGDTAPAGSLVIAAPRAAEDVRAGDILVMQRPGLANVTHRVIEVETEGTTAFAVTQGDANETPDATPYPLEGEELVSKWILPGWGSRLEAVAEPSIALAIVAIGILAIGASLLRRIWRAPQPSTTDRAEPAPRRESSWRRRLAAGVILPLVGLMTVGVAWALFASSEVVASNDFSTAECFDPELGSVQRGEIIHAVDGVVSVPITAVDPTSSFLLLSARSSGNEPVASTVRGQLAVGGTVVELSRATDAAIPEPLTVAWSVVEYPCGVSVQRGSLAGGGSNQLDIPIATVDPAASFVLMTSEAAATDADFDSDDLSIAELTSPTNVRIRSGAPAVLDANRRFSWQVVTFADAGDIGVQTVSTTLGSGVLADTITLAAPADPSTTFLLTGAATASAGADIGERLVRTHLASATTVEVSRQLGGDPIEVQVQVVTLKDGSSVRHGTVDFTAGQSIRAVSMDPVDPSRSTAISTVALPGPTAGGSTAMATDDVAGEASATFAIVDPETVSIARDATSAPASFAWQVIEWAGPQWWDPAYTFRQRIDANTTTAAAPDEYTLPVTIDHAALVANGLARADGADVRVLRWDGATWTELDRILDPDSAWDQSTTTAWFRTTDPIATASTSTYWLYFGNSSAGPAPADPENVFLLTEDFESGSLGDFEDRTGATTWYRAEPWTRRIPVTVPAAQVGADLTDFPLLVSLTQPDLAANAQLDGSDIRFTASDGVTPLDHEVESWDSGAGRLTAWVRVPTVSSTANTTVFLYYGAPDAPAQQDTRAVWSSAIDAAWHLARNPAGSAPQVDDSSPNNHDGLSGGAMSVANLVPGLVGDAIDLDGSNDVLQVENFELAGSEALTVSAWVRLNSLNGGRAVAKAADETDRIFELSTQNTGAIRVRLSLDGSTVELEAGAGTVSAGSWHHIAATWDGTTLRAFVDAVEVGNMPASGLIDVGLSMPVTLGNLATANRPIDGVLDEVRIERAARSTAWLDATVVNQRAPGVFAAPGPVQTGTWLDQGSWTYRKPIVVDADQFSAPASDFALFVDLIDPELAANAAVSGLDIVFTDADGATRLDHVIESFNATTGALAAWVRVPTVAPAVDTRLFAYYGNPTARDQQDATGVFGPDADLALALDG